MGGGEVGRMGWGKGKGTFGGWMREKLAKPSQRSLRIQNRSMWEMGDGK